MPAASHALLRATIAQQSLNFTAIGLAQTNDVGGASSHTQLHLFQKMAYEKYIGC
jgi:hypothetical protein